MQCASGRSWFYFHYECSTKLSPECKHQGTESCDTRWPALYKNECCCEQVEEESDHEEKKEEKQETKAVTPPSNIFDIFGASDAPASEDEWRRKAAKLQSVNAELKNENRQLKQKMTLHSPSLASTPGRYKEGSIRALEERANKSEQQVASLLLRLAKYEQQDDAYDFSAASPRRTKAAGAWR